jgi:hypothetical protein
LHNLIFLKPSENIDSYSEGSIIKMVENCATGQCECMSDETKKKITNMQVDGKDGDYDI